MSKSHHRTFTTGILVSVLCLCFCSVVRFVAPVVDHADSLTTVPKSQPYKASSLTAVKRCSLAQKDAILSVFNARSTPKTNCPKEPWLHFYFGREAASGQKKDFLAVNVGCNKATDAVILARVLSQDNSFQVNKWKSVLKLGAAGEACGASVDPSIFLNDSSPVAPLKGHVHCIEPMPSTFLALQNAWNQSSELYRNTIIMNHAAVSNSHGMAAFPDARSGVEYLSLDTCSGNSSAVRGARCENVQLTTLDRYFQDDPTKAASIDVLLIDTEGFDFEVLQGATETLKRARYVAFEVHSVGKWPTHSVDVAVHDYLHDFVCYWVGNFGQLWRITECVDMRFENAYDKRRSWSNVVCASRREQGLIDLMEDVFINHTIKVSF